MRRNWLTADPTRILVFPSSLSVRLLNLIPCGARWGLIGTVSYSALMQERFLSILGLVSLAISFLVREFSGKFLRNRQWDLIITSLLFFHVVFGVGLNFYETVFLFDKTLHLLWTFFIGLAVWRMAARNPPGRRTSNTLPLGILLVAASSFSLGGIWEIFEFLMDLLIALPQPAQIDLCDTMCDLMANLAGAVLAGGIVWFSSRESAQRRAIHR